VLSDASKLNVDDILRIEEDRTKQIVVVAIEGNQALVQNLGNATFAPGMLLIRESDTYLTTINSFMEPQIDKYSGDIIYIDNRNPITQTTNQIITLRTTLKF